MIREICLYKKMNILISWIALVARYQSYPQPIRFSNQMNHMDQNLMGLDGHRKHRTRALCLADAMLAILSRRMRPVSPTGHNTCHIRSARPITRPIVQGSVCDDTGCDNDTGILYHVIMWLPIQMVGWLESIVATHNREHLIHALLDKLLVKWILAKHIIASNYAYFLVTYVLGCVIPMDTSFHQKVLNGETLKKVVRYLRKAHTNDLAGAIQMICATHQCNGYKCNGDACERIHVVRCRFFGEDAIPYEWVHGTTMQMDYFASLYPIHWGEPNEPNEQCQ